jgi:hypothetical protein
VSTQSAEFQAIDTYLADAQPEQLVNEWKDDRRQPLTLILVEGFEERCAGIIEAAASARLPIAQVIVGIYASRLAENATYAERIRDAANSLGASITTFELTRDLDGLRGAVSSAKHDLLLDITGLSTRVLFGALDVAATYERQVYIGYSEAAQYWPTKDGWDTLAKSLATAAAIPDAVEEQPWLFGHDHRVELIPGHEGRDGIGRGRALVGFLPFKAARLAAVLAQEEYEDFVFIVGRPRLPSNHWRVDALRQINQYNTKDRLTIEMSTFGYLDALRQMRHILFSPTKDVHAPIIERYDVHIALLGSKLQDFACWALSRLMPTITVVTSVPAKYFPKSFSAGVGRSWIFRFGR